MYLVPVALPICGEPDISAEVLAFLRWSMKADELATFMPLPVTFLMTVIVPIGVDDAVEVACVFSVLVSVQLRVVLDESVIMPSDEQSPLNVGVKLEVEAPVSQTI
jgi:hypothetical protein